MLMYTNCFFVLAIRKTIPTLDAWVKINYKQIDLICVCVCLLTENFTLKKENFFLNTFLLYFPKPFVIET